MRSVLTYFRSRFWLGTYHRCCHGGVCGIHSAMLLFNFMSDEYEWSSAGIIQVRYRKVLESALFTYHSRQTENGVSDVKRAVANRRNGAPSFYQTSAPCSAALCRQYCYTNDNKINERRMFTPSRKGGHRL